MGVCDVPVIRNVCNVAGDAAGTIVTAPFDWLAESIGNAAEWMFTSVWAVIDSTTYVDVSSGEYADVYNIMFGIAIFMMLAFFLLQVMGGMVRREPAALSRAVVGLAKSVLGSFVVLTLLATALQVTDLLCVGIVRAAGTNMDEMGGRIAVLASGLAAIQVAAPGAGSILTIFLASLAIMGALIVWFSLLIRKALLLIAIVFAPIALAGASWDHTRSWVSRWASFVIAMILSKVVLVVIFLLATAEVSAPIEADLESVSQPIAGVVLMLLAGFAPYITYKAIAFMGFDMYHAMSAEQEAKSALSRPARVPAMPSLGRAGAGPASILTGGGGSGGGTGGGGAQGGLGGQSVAPSAVGGPGGSSGGSPSAAAVGSVGGVAGSGSAEAAGAGTGGGAAGGGAAGGTAVLAKETATAGPRLGGYVAAAAARAASAGEGSSPSAPPHVADTTLADDPDGRSRK
ncbi:conjugal transfer protein TrbL [Nocardioides sp. J2M5]|uniref:conjugal transfer protein TrbL n=1 Tax=Nocardioides palaemonis TaxID=2829810 RepID=UPI001BAD861B|nr:conjugal transfer protein TrbL [Nocardioides palaemonis]MBS2938520.1 conjugal transfer protein TrbL [Nocardioides palaemonis]MBS2938914.1 conjugal transfer protein TrbL [Nocardioides palaemonis]